MQNELLLKKYGWYIHYVSPDDSFPYGLNAHTHGVKKTFKHPDLQIVFPLPADIVQGIFTQIVSIIKKDKKVFSAGEKFYLDENYPVSFINCKERDVLRVILPDKYYKVFESEIIDDYYLNQYTV